MFTPSEKVSIRAHLGYLNVEEAQTFVLGTPAAVQTQFIVEGAMNRILPEAEGLARDTVAKLDDILCQIFGSTENAQVNQIGNIQLRPDAFKEQVRRYRFFQNHLANALGCYPNPYDQREWLGGGDNGVSFRVNH